MESYRQNKGSFTAFDGLELFYQSWVSDPVTGIIIIVHGLGEHSGRYQHIIDKLAGQGISFYALDHRGHGRSEGRRGHIKKFSDYIADLKKLVQLVKLEHPDKPLILLGHSMGGVIAFQYALHYPEHLQGLILSSAGLIPVIPVAKWKQLLGKILSFVYPCFSMPNEIDVDGLSHEPDIVKQYLKDPLVHDQVTARWFTEFTAAGQNLLQRAGELKLPLLIIHGKDDPIVDYRGSMATAEKASSSDKTIYIFDDMFHETMNETLVKRQQVLEKLADWILVHT